MPAMKTAAKSLIDQLERARQEPRRHLYLDHSRSPRRSTSAPANITQTWIDWTRLGPREQHLGYVQQLRTTRPRHTARQRQDLDAGPAATTGTAASPTATQDYDTKNTDADHVRRANAVLAEEYTDCNEQYCKSAMIPYAADHAAQLRLDRAEGARSTTWQPNGNTNQADRHGLGLA